MVMMMMTPARSLAQIVHLLVGFSAAVWAGDIQNYLSKFEGSNHQWYPTSFTRDIVPKPIHSHNDYWRKVPLYDAISVGCISVEVEVWHFDGDEELYVGYDLSSLTENRTLNSLYINPLLEILHCQNPEMEFGNNTYNGIFDTDPERTLYLYIDIKTSGVPTYNSILSHLTPLRPYLTYYNASSNLTHNGLLTVVLTRNTPFFEVSLPPTSSSHYARYAFHDAPLLSLSEPDSPYNTTNSLKGTAQFSSIVGRVSGGEMSEAQKEKLKGVIKSVHDRGIGVRLWDTPNWPVRWRNKVWRGLIECGVDLLNVDDLWVAAEVGW
ncbi:hypothetical protein L211DRAFT_829434 [Terfezia boudieri ATCC MYA-4762]|uniref:Altered inheritance of mitochondria protein 6 n=1 Tax=Terfezia boudieri ATCC MYA-4762 TaxID=1051890 RepID=A0A3N4LFY1_9PEZI|nr:hypothetical protein L211DRAFT_829434 [Terfezia boudieri ATCC MYA-4762]